MAQTPSLSSPRRRGYSSDNAVRRSSVKKVQSRYATHVALDPRLRGDDKLGQVTDPWQYLVSF